MRNLVYLFLLFVFSVQIFAGNEKEKTVESQSFSSLLEERGIDTILPDFIKRSTEILQGTLSPQDKNEALFLPYREAIQKLKSILDNSSDDETLKLANYFIFLEAFLESYSLSLYETVREVALKQIHRSFLDLFNSGYTSSQAKTSMNKAFEKTDSAASEEYDSREYYLGAFWERIVNQRAKHPVLLKIRELIAKNKNRFEESIWEETTREIQVEIEKLICLGSEKLIDFVDTYRKDVMREDKKDKKDKELKELKETFKLAYNHRDLVHRLAFILKICSSDFSFRDKVLKLLRETWNTDEISRMYRELTVLQSYDNFLSFEKDFEFVQTELAVLSSFLPTSPATSENANTPDPLEIVGSTTTITTTTTAPASTTTTTTTTTTAPASTTTTTTTTTTPAHTPTTTTTTAAPTLIPHNILEEDIPEETSLISFEENHPSIELFPRLSPVQALSSVVLLVTWYLFFDNEEIRSAL